MTDFVIKIDAVPYPATNNIIKIENLNNELFVDGLKLDANAAINTFFSYYQKPNGTHDIDVIFTHRGSNQADVKAN